MPNFNAAADVVRTARGGRAYATSMSRRARACATEHVSAPRPSDRRRRRGRWSARG